MRKADSNAGGYHAVVQTPFVNPVGIVENVAPPTTRRSRFVRLAVIVLLLMFGAAVIATTSISVGRYCLTTDADDVRTLPR